MQKCCILEVRQESELSTFTFLRQATNSPRAEILFYLFVCFQGLAKNKCSIHVRAKWWCGRDDSNDNGSFLFKGGCLSLAEREGLQRGVRWIVGRGSKSSNNPEMLSKADKAGAAQQYLWADVRSCGHGGEGENLEHGEGSEVEIKLSWRQVLPVCQFCLNLGK